MTTNQAPQWSFKVRSEPYQKNLLGDSDYTVERLRDMSSLPRWKIEQQLEGGYGLVRAELTRKDLLINQLESKVSMLEEVISSFEDRFIQALGVCQQIELEELSELDAAEELGVSAERIQALLSGYKAITEDLGVSYQAKFLDVYAVQELLSLSADVSRQALDDRSKVSTVRSALRSLKGALAN